MDYQSERSIYHRIQERYGIIGRSPEIVESIEKLWQAGPTDLTVLITGETGTGKEVFASAIHGISDRKTKPFVSVNCGAIPENLLESELFGHEKGAFTGASERRLGFFETADGGTIFLDEIGELPLQTQVKLLRILENGEFSRLGSSKVHKVNVRVIAATNRKLEEEVKSGNFRDDLYFRLNSVHIILPSLRDRSEDIPILASYFANKTAAKLGIIFEGFSEDAKVVMKSMPWKGNVRELKNLIETLITLEKTSYITSEILRKHAPLSLPAHEYEEIKGEKAIAKYERPEPSDADEYGLIFKSLLEIKYEMGDMKRMLYGIASQLEHINYRIEEIPYQKSERNTAENDTDLDEMPLDEIQKKIIISALKKNEGNRRKTAKSLGISERTLYRKLKEYDIKIEKY